MKSWVPPQRWPTTPILLFFSWTASSRKPTTWCVIVCTIERFWDLVSLIRLGNVNMSNHFPSDHLHYQASNGQTSQHFAHVNLPDIVSPTGPDPWFAIESTNAPTQPIGAAKVRSRTSTDKDQVKHRRTRSGCYTCRSRRVKVPPHPGLTAEIYSC